MDINDANIQMFEKAMVDEMPGQDFDQNILIEASKKVYNHFGYKEYLAKISTIGAVLGAKNASMFGVGNFTKVMNESSEEVKELVSEVLNTQELFHFMAGFRINLSVSQAVQKHIHLLLK